MSKLYHPDKITNSVDESVKQSSAITYELLSLAYNILTDNELRKEYDQLYFVEKQIKNHNSLKGAHAKDRATRENQK